jgi:chromosome partitioning protein
MKTFVVTNLKGGTAKTTTGAFLAHALADAGLSVLMVDADPQGSALRWAESAGWELPVVGLPIRTLHTKLAEIAGDRDAVVVDTPPLDEARGIVLSALRVADHVLIPTAPTPIEVERLPMVRTALEDVAELRADGRPPLSHILLTRTVSNAASTSAWRAAIADEGWNVLTAEIRRLEVFAQAFGDPIRNAADTDYGMAVAELLDVIA